MTTMEKRCDELAKQFGCNVFVYDGMRQLDVVRASSLISMQALQAALDLILESLPEENWGTPIAYESAGIVSVNF